MQELNFRRKRKSPGQKPRRQTKGTKLRFEDRRKKLYFEKRKTGKRPVSIRRVLGLLLQAEVVCAAAVFLSVSFGYRVSNAGDSMNPVLKNGDVVLVNRLIYEIKDPSRGDIVVFRPGGDENSHYSIKRIVGLPGETGEQMLDTIRFLNRLPIRGIKLQLLHVLSGTDLAEDYEKGYSRVLAREEYIELLIRCLEELRPDIVIHRLTGDGPKKLLIAPQWSSAKRSVLNTLHHEMALRRTWQGRLYQTN